jgi:hypothetical protein
MMLQKLILIIALVFTTYEGYMYRIIRPTPQLRFPS